MIFVTVGTNEARFDRLLTAVSGLRLDEPVLVQHGHSSPMAPPGGEVVDFLSFEAMVDAILRARVVITHAGVGSMMVCLAHGKRPVVVPRLKTFGEAVDDHQLQLARRFGDAGFVTALETTDDLAAALAAGTGRAAAPRVSEALVAELRAFVADTLAARSAPASA